ncbi:MAG: ABC transporter permease subunit [Candidatus Cloacimonetes bacterium]|nr:ABC transporter permease subunit [Candidatus Cloacimonadota bacterium]
MNFAQLISKKETNAYFDSPSAYIFLVVFLLFSGWFFASPLFLANSADMRTLFNMIPILFLFFVPVITMGLLARERSSGTIELLATFPLTEVQIIMGKFWAALKLISIGLLFTLLHLLTIIILGTNIDYGAIFCGYIGLLMVGAVYASIGIFASSLSNNQIVAFIISFAIIFVLYMLQYSLFFIPAAFAGFFQYISIGYHYSNMARGVIDTRNLIYFLSLITIFLRLAIAVLEIRKWK